MRFEIGQQIPFINVRYHKKPNVEKAFSFLFDPRIHDLDSVEVKILTVKEHHKVPSTYGPKDEKNYDGFIFTEQINENEEQLWKNQYPTATYGQLSDENDRTVFRHTTHSKEEIERMSYEELKYWTERWHTALDFIANIKRAIVGGKRHGLELSPENRKLFEDYLLKVQNTIEEATGKKIQYKIATYKSKEGVVTELEGYWEAEMF